MRDYKLPKDAHELLSYVSDVESRARRAEQTVAEQLEHLRQANEERRADGMAELERRAREIEKERKAAEADLREMERANDATEVALGERERALHRAEREFAQRQQEENEDLGERERAFQALVSKTVDGFGFIAEAWADYESARAKLAALDLKQKDRPAPIAAEAVRAKGAELAEAIRRAKAAEWIVELYEWHLPWITELREAAELESFVQDDHDEEKQKDEDPAAKWLTREEYNSLATADRNQRSLDRYLKSRKTPWQLGRDYERYVGYLREQQGCKVTYHGIFKGLEDLGRDVLAEKDGQLEVIQCKRWAREKTIHEKHIFQLYGTVVLAKLENPEQAVAGTFATTTRLSPKAREVAEYLGIRVEEGVPLDDYPRIKCNVARGGTSAGEKIYHLPFDQQYDTTIIEPERGECYIQTVAEAEQRGFRRAWRWRRPEATAAASD